jgi:pyruvate dehydrogenase E2 component (dihydrolipoamide acetyltransferase)
MTIHEIHKKKKQFLREISGHRVKQYELVGGTFTISNLGMHGADAIFPIIYQKQSAILGIGKINQKPIYKGDRIIGAKLMLVTLGIDHRVTDGETAARFLNHMQEILNEPALWSTEME